MSKIKTLPPIVANQIAAGEVVERPASILKELIENSLDANARDIQVDVLQGGLSFLRVKDDGEGISKEDLPLSLVRHATSKVATLEDLMHIASLGFRGEALASIASVAKCVIRSRPKAQETGWACSVQGDDLNPYLYPAAPVLGTTVEIRDLFYNTPARRKFLKSVRTEFYHLEQVFKSAALSRPDVSFTLTHNEKIIKAYKQGDLAARVKSVMGAQFINHALILESEHQRFSLKGYVGQPHTFRKHADHQYFFLNGRVVRDKVVQHAIKNGFFADESLQEQNQPSFVIFLNCPLEEVDINVHPTKHEVRFSDPTWVHDYIQNCVQATLKETVPQQALPLKAKPYATYSKEAPSPNPTHVEPTFAQGLHLDIDLPKPKSTTCTQFWGPFFLDFQKDMKIIDLRDNKTIWSALFNDLIKFPWPKRLQLIPKNLGHHAFHVECLSQFGFHLKKNLQGAWSLMEAPTFLDESQIHTLFQALQNKEPKYTKSVLENYFMNLPLMVFQKDLYFQNRFEQWCHTGNKTFVQTLSVEAFTEWVAEVS